VPSDLNKITNPYLFEINTWPWLAAISKNEGTAIDLGSVPDRYWDEIADLGFDGVWLMGVWQRSPVGIAIALSNDRLRARFRRRSSRLATLRRCRIAVLRTRLCCR
jgi:hypothetical protein